ncbi:MAG: tRNA (adenosine(37)-N6)-threonylcarbamoyltransferase complex dimerization subunit type 1 TsaB [Prevotellaceae bacterium]|nr:tRNA (adenosine(37)-N6)-threonylcarbamoyltransferase complex dimerization subunit type 1 TsaB [Prevotellaceae bacterium]
MACILNIETSTNVCSVAVSSDGEIIFNTSNQDEDCGMGGNHANVLGDYVKSALSFADNHAIPVDAVAISCGPGSYTGLRVGVSMAKGVCYGMRIPLISVPTLNLLCVPLLLNEKIPENALLCPMLDARRMEVYTAVYDRALKVQSLPEDMDVQISKNGAVATVLNENSFNSLLMEHDIYFFGNGSVKYRDCIKQKSATNDKEYAKAHFIDGIIPLAKHIMPLAEMKYLRNEFENVAYFEPFYLKEFVAIKSRNILCK